jgi:hypothetical protein
MFNGKGVTGDPAGFTYWKVANGIRLTGMPAFTGTLYDVQIWQVSQLLANGSRLPSTARHLLSAGQCRRHAGVQLGSGLRTRSAL